jgi:replicative DNA helicase
VDTSRPAVTAQPFAGEVTGPRLVLLSSLVGELVTEAREAERAIAEGRPRGAIIGLKSVDDDLGGYLTPGIHLLQAAPGAGKTSFCLQAAARCGVPALVISAEMSLKELFKRLIAQQTGTYLGRLRGELSAVEIEERALQTVRLCPMVAIVDGTTGFVPPSFIAQAVEALRARFGSGSVLVVLDSLHVWARGVQGGATEYETVTAACGSLHTLTKQIKCPVLAVSHRNRAGQERGGLHAGKATGELEYVADSVLELAPGEHTQPNVREVALWIHKNRNGQTGVMVELTFEGRLQLFREAEGYRANYSRRP